MIITIVFIIGMATINLRRNVATLTQVGDLDPEVGDILIANAETVLVS